MGSVPVFTKDPYAPGTLDRAASQVDRLIGSAYEVVRQVAENLEYIKHVSAHLEQIFRVYESIEGIDALYDNIELLDKLLENLDAILEVAEIVDEIKIVAVNIEAVGAVSDNIEALVHIYENIDAILALGPAAVIVSPTAPVGAFIQGHMWWNSITGDLYMWYEDPNSNQWVQISGGTGDKASAIVADSLPGDVENGQLWWNSTTSDLYVWYDDGNSAQWVQINIASNVSVWINPLNFTSITGMAAKINAAIMAANARGGGLVVIPNLGTVWDLEDKIVMLSNVWLEGLGSPTLRLMNGVNKTVIESQNFLSLVGANAGAGISNFGISGLIVDGNRTNNTSPAANEGNGISLVGRDFYVNQVEIINSSRRGLHTEYPNGVGAISPVNGNVSQLLTSLSGEEGWYNAVSDLHASNVNIRGASLKGNNTYNSLHLQWNIRGVNINVWGAASTPPFNKHAIYIGSNGAGTTLYGAHIDAGSTSNIRIDGDHCDIRGLLSYSLFGIAHAQVDANYTKLQIDCFSSGIAGEATTEVGVQLGVTATKAACEIDVQISGANGGAVDFTNSAGNIVRINHYLASGGVQHIGTPHALDDVTWFTRGATTAEDQYMRKQPMKGGSITPAGTTQGTATLIATTFGRVFSTVAAAGVILPGTYGSGTEIALTNNGTATTNIYPPVGHNFFGVAVNTPVTLPINATWQFRWEITTNWSILKSA